MALTELNNADFYKVPVDNAGLTPFSGFDADIWVLDAGTGKMIQVGRFTSMQVTVRNATEPYLEVNQRNPMLLDGEFQIGWVLERGQLDTRILEQTFGYSNISRELRNNRNTRFQISFAINAPELTTSSTVFQPTSQDSNPYAVRQAVGELVLVNCKVDSFTIGVNSGRNVIANRWEGMSEGIYQTNRTATDPGTYLNSVSSFNSLQIKPTESPYPWDAVIYDSYRQGNSGNGVLG
jgi:hypothetical protein